MIFYTDNKMIRLFIIHLGDNIGTAWVYFTSLLQERLWWIVYLGIDCGASWWHLEEKACYLFQMIPWDGCWRKRKNKCLFFYYCVNHSHANYVQLSYSRIIVVCLNHGYEYKLTRQLSFVDFTPKNSQTCLFRYDRECFHHDISLLYYFY